MTSDSDAPLFGKQALGPGNRPPTAGWCVDCPDHEHCATGGSCATARAVASSDRAFDGPIVRRKRASVYLAGPIDQVVPGITAHRRYLADRSILAERLQADGFAVYRPDRAWAGVNLTRDDCPAVEAANQAALEDCDYLVALTPAGVPSSGTRAEVLSAARRGQPAVTIGAGLERIAGVVTVATISEAMPIIRQFRASTGRAPVARDVSIAETESTLPLPVLPLAGSQFLPMRHYDDDAGFDLFVTEQRTVMPGQFVDVPAGVRIEVPPHLWALILGRSSTMRKRGLMVLPGVIDTGWRGDWFVGVTNVGEHPVTVAVGERVGQFVLLPNLSSQYAPVVTDALSPHPRGENGFGSTGGHAEPLAAVRLHNMTGDA